MSIPKTTVKCPECGCNVVFSRVRSVEIETQRKAIKDCHKTITTLVEAGKAEKVRRDTIESDLRAEIRKLQDELKFIQENRQV